jgi:hypothetical protein
VTHRFWTRSRVQRFTRLLITLRLLPTLPERQLELERQLVARQVEYEATLVESVSAQLGRVDQQLGLAIREARRAHRPGGAW